MLVEKGDDHAEIKRRIHDCRERLRRQRASQRSAAHDDARPTAESEIAVNGDGEDNGWSGELMLEEEAKV